MAFYRLQRMWTSLLVVGVPVSLLTIVWAIFRGGRVTTAALAGCYLLIVIAGRAHAAEQARRQKPVRQARVRTQLDRVRSTLPLDAPDPELQPTS